MQAEEAEVLVAALVVEATTVAMVADLAVAELDQRACVCWQSLSCPRVQ